MEVPDNMKQVVSYLRDLGQTSEVINTFITQKLDEVAIWHADNDLLHKHGIIADGDIIRLKIKCKGDTNIDERKKELKSIIEFGTTSRTTFSTPKAKKTKRPAKEKTIYVSWKNFTEGHYAIVKTEKGGGSRKMLYNGEMNRAEVLDSCVEEFWNNRKVKAFKKKSDYHFMLADHKNEVLSDVIKDTKTMDVPFTINNYLNLHKLTRPRLYLFTKLKSSTSKVLELSKAVDLTSDDSDSDFNESKPAIETLSVSNDSTFSENSPLPAVNLSSITASDQAFPLNTSLVSSTAERSVTEISDQVPTVSSLLVGTSAERTILRNEINEAYQQSVADDIEKERLQQEQIRLTDLMNARKARIDDEPSLFEEHVTVTVRHVTEGNKVRIFKATHKMVQVYDWAGSFSPNPEYFKLLNYRNVVIMPDDDILSGVFNMQITEDPINMSSDGNVAFRGFGSIPISPELPSVNTSTHDNEFMQIVNFQKKNSDALIQEHGYYTLSRENIYETMLAIYDTDAYLSVIRIGFEGESGVGEGVTRDAFTSFFHEVFQKFEGHNERIPSLMIEESELCKIGKIIHHAFILYGIFPVELCKSSLKFALFNNVSEDDLLDSFFQFLPENEVSLIKRFENKTEPTMEVQPLIDILTDHRVFDIPTPNNISQLCLKAATVTLIKSPCFSMRSIVNGMGESWKTVSQQFINMVYSSSIVSAVKIIENISANEINSQDQKITTWLHRYVRNCTCAELKCFLRFISGATNITGEKIKVEFVNQPVNYLRPTSATCFKILRLPRQYSSFSHLRSNLNTYINNSSLWAVHDHDDDVVPL